MMHLDKHRNHRQRDVLCGCLEPQEEQATHGHPATRWNRRHLHELDVHVIPILESTSWHLGEAPLGELSEPSQSSK